MEPDEYRPDPPAGLAYGDFRGARARYLARVAAQAEITRLERAWGLAFPSLDATAVGSDAAGEGRLGGPAAGGAP